MRTQEHFSDLIFTLQFISISFSSLKDSFGDKEKMYRIDRWKYRMGLIYSQQQLNPFKIQVYFSKKAMIRFIHILTLSFISMNLWAQKPVEIRGVAKEDFPPSYYKEQASLWKKEIDIAFDNGYAWLQYFKAQRAYLILTKPDIWQHDSPKIYAELQPIIDEAAAHIKDQFDWYFMRAVNTFNPKEALTLFEKAFDLDPDRYETYGWLFTQYARQFNDGKARPCADKILENNLYSNANYLWNFNAMQGMEENAIFIGNGDMDVLPKWVLQHSTGIRTDLIVISKWLVASDTDYRNTIFKRLNINNGYKKPSEFPTYKDWVNYITLYMIENSENAVYMSCGTQTSFFEKNNIIDKMYLEGLNYRYSKQGIDNIAKTVTLFEEVYRLDHLQSNFQHHLEDEMVHKQMHLTYLPGLVEIKNYYLSKGEKSKAQPYDALIQTIATNSGKRDTVLEWFD